jgi:leucyl-tRNA synthetase
VAGRLWRARQLINSGEFDGLDFAGAFDAIEAALIRKDLGKSRTQFRLRDWGISRQRYWGCPIPIIHCPPAATCRCRKTSCRSCCRRRGAGRRRFAAGAHARILRVQLPEMRRRPSAKPTPWTPSSSRPGTSPATPRRTTTKAWSTRRQPLAAGGSVHRRYRTRHPAPAVRALLPQADARRRPGQLERAVQEPADPGHGVAETYYRVASNGGKDWFNPADVELERDAKAKVIGARLKTDGLPVEIGGTEKMSKSKNNGVDPQSMIEVRRRHLPPVHDVRLAARHEPGMVRLRRRRRHRFLRRVWRLAQAHVSQGLPGKLDVAALTTQKAMRRAIHLAIKQASTTSASSTSSTPPSPR